MNWQETEQGHADVKYTNVSTIKKWPTNPELFQTHWDFSKLSTIELFLQIVNVSLSIVFCGLKFLFPREFNFGIFEENH